MRGRTEDCSSLPEPTGPTDDRFVYRLTPTGKQILAEHPTAGGAPLFVPAAPVAEIADAVEAHAKRRRRSHLHRRARDRGRRLGTISTLCRNSKRLPFLRLSGGWLREAGFDEGRHFEIEVEDGRLTIEAV